MHSPGGIFLEDVHTATFDAGFLNSTQAEVTALDLQQQLLLRVKPLERRLLAAASQLARVLLLRRLSQCW